MLDVFHGDGNGRNKRGRGVVVISRTNKTTRTTPTTMTTTRPILPFIPTLLNNVFLVILVVATTSTSTTMTKMVGVESALALVSGARRFPTRCFVPTRAASFRSMSTLATIAPTTAPAITRTMARSVDDDDDDDGGVRIPLAEMSSSTVLDAISCRGVATSSPDIDGGGDDDVVVVVGPSSYRNDDDDDEGWRVVSSLIASLNSCIDDASTSPPRATVAATRREVIARHFASDVVYVDMSSFYSTIIGRDDLIRHVNIHYAGSSSSSSSSSSGLFGIVRRGGGRKDESSDGRRRKRRRIVVDDFVSSSSSSSSTTTTTTTSSTTTSTPTSSMINDNEDDKDDDGSSASLCVLYHLEEEGGEEEGGFVIIPDTTAISFYNLRRDGKYDNDGNGSGAVGESTMRIASVIDVSEPPTPKPGDAGLALLRSVSRLFTRGRKATRVGRKGADSIVVDGVDGETAMKDDSVVRRYYDAWNRRDVGYASSLFADDCVMRDLQYDESFIGRDEFQKHLRRVADCLPDSFNFVVDDLVSTSRGAGVVWHVENDGATLPFTRGCSFYTLDPASGLIRSGYEIPERAPPKMGFIRTLTSKFDDEPIRLVPALLWVAYMYVLFVSDGILPGANAFALELRTWEEVRDLSINFFLVSPALHLPFSPVVHPMLEGVFNLLLAWAAMFSGFLSDEREDKPNLLPFGPMLVGMQFLTSGFLLPYLFTRTSERSIPEEGTMSLVVYQEDISGVLQREIAEWRPLGFILGVVGTSSIVWGFFGRPEYGDIGIRYASFLDLLSIDRVGSSFIVDLAIFAAFQGWFVDDDLRRRGVALNELTILRNSAKFVPFFGLVAYLTLRPPLPIREED
ncbi:hypothetical protein ACHAXA_005073 [Cyclostephanos tholiformis]|uniref:SnoaL-like domain-containing protein n=1 Tax=Cyclostephanos tholiformis TaxID=382380 RepID=A0ABD3SRU0_9STRA